VPNISFSYPWLLLGLTALPLLIWLVRLTPPPPRKILFPATWLIARLRPTESVSAKSPWWLLLLRGLLAISLIVAAARPVLNGSGPLSGDGPLFLVVDNGWVSAENWSARQDLATDLLRRAGQANRPAALLPTALKSGTATGFRRAGETAKIAAALTPAPWSTARNTALDQWNKLTGSMPKIAPQVIWLSNGIAGEDDNLFIERLRRIGRLTVVMPDPDALPVILGDITEEDGRIEVTARRLTEENEATIFLTAKDRLDRVLARNSAPFAAGETETLVTFDLPIEHRNRLARMTTQSPRTAAEIVLFDDSARRHPVGLVETDLNRSLRPLLGQHYYLERALTPTAEVGRGAVETLLKRDRAVMILTDPPALSPQDQKRLKDWTAAGGMIIRFAGPNLSTAKDGLVPVPLRQGDRAMGGALSWRDPPGIAPFGPDSPFHGLEIPTDIKISRQVLADPNRMGEAEIWARLADGTPLITAARKDKGWLVLIHVTSTTDWSNLPLSGLFVDLLDRLVRLSQGAAQAEPQERLAPERLLSADGILHSADGKGQAIPAGTWEETEATADHPPGFYKGPEGAYALNLQTAIPEYRSLELPFQVEKTDYDAAPEKDLSGWLWGLALVLLALDGLVSLKLRGGLARSAVMALLLLTLTTPELHAEDTFALEATRQTRIAYMLTGDTQTDAISRNGLEALTRILSARSAAELGAPMGLDPERHDPVFFPLIYWPVTGHQPDLSDNARQRIDRYLANGGTILFDRLDGGAEKLEQMGEWLRLPPMNVIPDDHVLTRTFYLIDRFPGRWTGEPLWIAGQDAGQGDGVSPALVGGHDWAAAWATDENQRPLFALAPGGERQRENAYRFGVNLMIYVLTGNYKRDQVHLPIIMERLQR